MKQRAKPWDRRKHPYVRAMMETLKNHQLNMSSTEGSALCINCNCHNDAATIEKWFQSPKLDNNRSYHDPIQAWLVNPDNAEFKMQVWWEMKVLFEQYSVHWDGPDLK